MNYLVLDIATAPLPNAADFLEGEFAAPSNYKDPEKIAAYIAEAKANALAFCALDPDLCRISGVAWWALEDGQDSHLTCGSQAFAAAAWDLVEKSIVEQTADLVNLYGGHRLISYNGLKFDWPVLNARARYLGVKLNINLDRFKSPHIDLYAKLTNHGQLKGHTLGWWVRRHGWTDLQKPLEGAQEAKVFETGQWAELAASLCHDVEACRRLAVWLGILSEQPSLVAASDARRGTP